ncbi:MAG: hypothetical protein IPN53_19030 [Comamonadaceae bacterium]|nr:hypothetical protein [Comamonadaceae bacterium]
MNIILAGLSPRDETAFDLFLKRFMAGWHWQGLPAKKGAPLPGADVLVVDLAAHGWAQHSAQAQAQLQLATGQSVAVLLVSSHDASWPSAKAGFQQQKWIWLGKPYNAESMRSALSQAAALVKDDKKPASSVLPPAAAGNPMPATSLPKAFVLPGLSVSTVATPPAEKVAEDDPAGVLHAPDDHGLSPDDLAAQLSLLPAERFLLLRKLSAGLQARTPFEVRFTVQHCLVVHPADGWVASNTPKPVILRVCNSDALAASVTFREIEVAQVEERLHQLGMSPHDLSDFLRELAVAAIPASPPKHTPST